MEVAVDGDWYTTELTHEKFEKLSISKGKQI